MDQNAKRWVAGAIASISIAVSVAMFEVNLLISGALLVLTIAIVVWGAMRGYTSRDIRMETAVEEVEVPRMNFKYGEGVNVVSDSLSRFMHVVNLSPTKGTSWPQPVYLRLRCTEAPKEVAVSIHETVNKDPADPSIAVGKRLPARYNSKPRGKSVITKVSEPIMTGDRAITICVVANHDIAVLSAERST